MDQETFFDLASLTKPLVVSLSLLVLLQQGRVGMKECLDNYFTGSVSWLKKISLEQLLTHCSGLPSHRPYYKKLIILPEKLRKKQLLDWILGEKLQFQPGTDYLYSDLGFMLLGNIVEKVSGEPLHYFWKRMISDPLKLSDSLFFNEKGKKRERVYAATGACVWSGKRLCGRVHDDNCRAIGGVAGHAGLFGSTEGVLSLCENLLQQYREEKDHPFYSSALLRETLKLEEKPWKFGFDTPTPGLSSSGKYFSRLSIGHLGFTGTSFWIDLEKGVAIVFLTNRVLCGDSTKAIKDLRPRLHDAIMKSLIEKTG